MPLRPIPIPGPRPIPLPPAPAPVPVPTFLSGPQVAALYSNSWFCYGFDPVSNSCALLENRIGSPAGTLVIERITRVRLPRSTAVAIGSIASFRPDGLWVYQRQTLRVTLQGLCQSRGQRIADALATGIVLVERVNDPDASFEPLGGEALDDYRQRQADQVANAPGGETCARYRRPPDEPSVLLEESFVDGVRQPAEPSRIVLIPRTGRPPQLIWQN